MPEARSTRRLSQQRLHDAALAHLRRADPVLAGLIDAHPGFDPRAWLKDLPAMDAFGALLFQVAGQQLSVQATRRIVARLQRLFGGHLPAPAELLAADPGDLHDAGLSRRKVATLRTLAGQFASGTVSGDGLQELSDEEILARLTAIRGIGPWTVHGFLIIALGRTDVVLPGDLALRRAIESAYQLGHLPSQQEVLQIAEPWRPYRSLATAYLFQTAFEPRAAAEARMPGDGRGSAQPTASS
jgi:DNA-3-methyladenine glycosylase II